MSRADNPQLEGQLDKLFKTGDTSSQIFRDAYSDTAGVRWDHSGTSDTISQYLPSISIMDWYGRDGYHQSGSEASFSSMTGDASTLSAQFAASSGDNVVGSNDSSPFANLTEAQQQTLASNVLTLEQSVQAFEQLFGIGNGSTPGTGDVPAGSNAATSDTPPATAATADATTSGTKNAALTNQAASGNDTNGDAAASEGSALPTSVAPANGSITAAAPEGGALLYSNSFNSAGSDAANGVTNGINDVAGQGTSLTWNASGGIGSDLASNVSFGTNGAQISTNLAAKTSGSFSLNETIGSGGNIDSSGSPITIQAEMSGSQNWDALWMLPQGGGNGAQELDLQEAGFSGSNSLSMHYHEPDGTTIGQTVQAPSGVNLANMNTYDWTIQPNSSGGSTITESIDGQDVGTMNTPQNVLAQPMKLLADSALATPGDGWQDAPVQSSTPFTISGIQIYQ